MSALHITILTLGLLGGAAGRSFPMATEPAGDGLIRLKLYRSAESDPAEALVMDSRFKQLFASLNETNTVESGIQTHSMINVNGVNFFTEIKLGNPAKTYRVLLDTGSYDLWLPSAACPDENCKVRRNYNSLESTNYIPDGRKALVRYANQVEISGHLSVDSMKINQLLVKQQTFIEAMKMTGEAMREMPFDGIMGISVPHDDLALEGNLLNGTTSRHKSPIMNILEHRSVRQKVFSFSVRHRVNSNEAGELILGGLDTSAYRGEIHWIPLLRLRKWEFRLDLVGLADQTSRRLVFKVCPYGCSAVPDTGTFLIGGHNEDITLLNQQLGASNIGNGVFAFNDTDCRNLIKLPHLVFRIANRDFLLPPNLYVIRTRERCYSALRIVEGLSHWILGDLFLNNFYSIFDYENKRLGLAESIY